MNLQPYHPDVPLSEGVWAGVPESEYHSFQALNQSRLKLILDDPSEFANPANYTTRNMIFGKAGHCAVLEPKQFYDRFRVSKFESMADFRRDREQLRKDKPGLILLTPDEGQRLLKIYKNAKQHQRLPEYLRGCVFEVTIVFLYRGRLFKARLDALRMINENYLIIDLKFISEKARPRIFSKMIEDRKLHFQAALYCLALKSMIVRPIKIYFGWVVIEMVGKCRIALYNADEDDILDGLDEVNHALDLLEVHEQKKEFDAFPQDFVTCKRPYWARRRGRTA